MNFATDNPSETSIHSELRVGLLVTSTWDIYRNSSLALLLLQADNQKCCRSNDYILQRNELCLVVVVAAAACCLREKGKGLSVVGVGKKVGKNTGVGKKVQTESRENSSLRFFVIIEIAIKHESKWLHRPSLPVKPTRTVAVSAIQSMGNWARTVWNRNWKRSAASPLPIVLGQLRSITAIP